MRRNAHRAELNGAIKMKILFIGNSYIYYNDMPMLFSKLANENGRDVEVDSVTVGGRKLIQNLEHGDEHAKKISEFATKNQYDILILQEQSYFALIEPDEFERGVGELISLVAAKSNLLYATWGRKSGSELLEKYGWTSSQMGKLLDAAYCKAAEKYSARVSHVGLCFEEIFREHAQIELYNEDLSHPSYIGTCLGVISHYRAIFGELPKKLDSLCLEDNVAKLFLTTVEKYGDQYE